MKKSIPIKPLIQIVIGKKVKEFENFKSIASDWIINEFDSNSFWNDLGLTKNNAIEFIKENYDFIPSDFPISIYYVKYPNEPMVDLSSFENNVNFEVNVKSGKFPNSEFDIKTVTLNISNCPNLKTLKEIYNKIQEKYFLTFKEPNDNNSLAKYFFENYIYN